MRPHTHLTPCVDTVTGPEYAWPGFHAQADVYTGTQMCTQTCNCCGCTHIHIARTHTHASRRTDVGTSTYARASINKLTSLHTLYTTGAQVHGNAELQRHRYRHVLLSVHLDTARLVNTRALKHTHVQAFKCGSYWIQECAPTEHTHTCHCTDTAIHKHTHPVT